VRHTRFDCPFSENGVAKSGAVADTDDDIDAGVNQVIARCRKDCGAGLPPPIKTAADQSADVTRRTSRHRYTRAVGSVERELAAAFAFFDALPQNVRMPADSERCQG
jgi:hypothetical protein